MAGIALEGVTKRFGAVTALDDVSLSVPDGELLVVVGPSGCGKTTLLRLIAGLEQPDAGEVHVDGRRVTDLPARKRDVSLVFQDFALFPHLSARENVAFDLRMQGYDDVDGRVADAADLLDVGDLLDRSIDELSGGQKQRIALGRAIVTDPAGFLLDEPLANLDANLRARMQTEIVRLQERLGVTTVHVTHDQSEALRMGDRVAVVADGTVQQVGPPERIYRSPASLFVARFVGNPTMNLLAGRLDVGAGALELPAGTTVPLPGTRFGTGRDDIGPTDRDVVLGVRPEHVALRAGSPDGDDWLSATVQFDEFEGADRFVHLDGPTDGDLVARVPAARSFPDGATVSASLARGRAHVFDAATGERLATVEGADVAGSAAGRAAAPPGRRPDAAHDGADGAGEAEDR